MSNEQKDLELDQRMTFRLPARHKRLIEKEAKNRYATSGDVLREIVREWVEKKTGRV